MPSSGTVIPGLCVSAILAWHCAVADVVPEGYRDGGCHTRHRSTDRIRTLSASAEAVAAVVLPTVNWAPSEWVDVPGEEVLQPLDLVCLGGVVMLAFHFAGQTARRPTSSQRATTRDLMGELGLVGKYPKVEKRDLAALVEKAKAQLYSLRQELKSVHGMPDEHVACVQKKLQGLCSDMSGVAVPTHIGGAFAAIDKNGDGMLDKKDLVELMRRIGGNNFSDNELEVLFAAADLNCDGQLDFMEFVNFIFQGGDAQNAIASAVGNDADIPQPLPLKRSKSGRRQRNADGSVTYVQIARPRTVSNSSA